jgi:hypothetical protein
MQLTSCIHDIDLQDRSTFSALQPLNHVRGSLQSRSQGPASWRMRQCWLHMIKYGLLQDPHWGSQAMVLRRQIKKP